MASVRSATAAALRVASQAGLRQTPRLRFGQPVFW